MVLKMVRRKCGMTQYELALAAGLTLHRVAEAERGRVQLNDRERAAIADVLSSRYRLIFFGDAVPDECPRACVPFLAAGDAV